MSKGRAARMRKAHKALASCRALLEQGDTEGACNRAYYAMFHAAHVALESVGALDEGAVYKTHSGLIGAFGQRLVLTKTLSDRLGRSLSKVYDTRLLADYASEPPDEATAEWIVGEAECFVVTIQSTFGP